MEITWVLHSTGNMCMFSVNTSMNKPPLSFSLDLLNQDFSVYDLKCWLVKFADRSPLPHSLFIVKIHD